MTNKELAKELRKPNTIKFKKRKIQSSSIYSIWGAVLADL